MESEKEHPSMMEEGSQETRRDNSGKADVLRKKLLRHARKVTKLKFEMFVQKHGSGSFSSLYRFVQSDLGYGVSDRVPLKEMAHYLGATNRRFDYTEEVVQDDSSTPYTRQEKKDIIRMGKAFCQKMNKGYAKFKEELLTSPVVQRPLDDEGLFIEMKSFEKYNVKESRDYVEEVTKKLQKTVELMQKRVKRRRRN